MSYSFGNKVFRDQPHIIQLYGYVREMQVHLVNAGITIGDTGTMSSLGPAAYLGIEIGGEEKLNKFLDTWSSVANIYELSSVNKRRKLFRVYDRINFAFFDLCLPEKFETDWTIGGLTTEDKEEYKPYSEKPSLVLPKLFITPRIKK